MTNTARTERSRSGTQSGDKGNHRLLRTLYLPPSGGKASANGMANRISPTPYPAALAVDFNSAPKHEHWSQVADLDGDHVPADIRVMKPYDHRDLEVASEGPYTGNVASPRPLEDWTTQIGWAPATATRLNRRGVQTHSGQQLKFRRNPDSRWGSVCVPLGAHHQL